MGVGRPQFSLMLSHRSERPFRLENIVQTNHKFINHVFNYARRINIVEQHYFVRIRKLICARLPVTFPYYEKFTIPPCVKIICEAISKTRMH